MEKEKIARGTKIICPKCFTLIGTTLKALHKNRDLADFGAFLFLDHIGQDFYCPKCKEPWVKAVIHTTKGWDG